MAGKTKSVFICTECGAESLKWCGKCPNCGEWNTLQEEIRTAQKESAAVTAVKRGISSMQRLSDVDTTAEARYTTGMQELDRVLGGGIVKGALMLIGGDPGIGKSTLLLQICHHLGQSLRVLYVSGEESKRQIKLRANRLGVKDGELYILCETDIELVVHTMLHERPDVVIVDSIQTMTLEAVSSSAGSVTQVRECTNRLMHAAKDADIPVFVVGHVNKDGAIAGPKVLEHIVDCVLYFEGDRNTSYRLLRSVKNRYGSTNEVGVFEMRDRGLCEVENPSLMLLSERPTQVSGSCVACTMEGTRSLLAEVQGLVTPTGFGSPRRMSTGFDYNRVALILAVLEKRAGYFFSNLDTYVNIVGGLRLDEPAADLPLALALISSLKDTPIPDHIAAFGEIGLAGELRSVSNADARISEAARLGFERVLIPAANMRTITQRTDIEIIGVSGIREAWEML